MTRSHHLSDDDDKVRLSQLKLRLCRILDIDIFPPQIPPVFVPVELIDNRA